MKLLVYRVDGGPETGLGHVARARAVTEAAQGLGEWRLLWASRGGPHVEGAAIAAGADLILRDPSEEEQTFLLRAGRDATAMIIDHKLPYTASEIAALRVAHPVVLLDVECEGMFEASATVFPTAHLDPEVAADQRWHRSGRLLHGPEWVLLHPQILAAIGRPAGAGTKAPRVAVTAGGADPLGVSLMAMDWLDHVDRELTVDLLVGAANPRRAQIAERARAASHPTRVATEPEEFPVRLAAATVAVAVFGITAYELAYLGVPAILVSHTIENARDANRFARWGTAEDLGLATGDCPERVAHAIERLLDDRSRRMRMRDAGRRLLDGHGAERIVELVGQLASFRAT